MVLGKVSRLAVLAFVAVAVVVLVVLTVGDPGDPLRAGPEHPESLATPPPIPSGAEQAGNAQRRNTPPTPQPFTAPIDPPPPPDSSPSAPPFPFSTPIPPSEGSARFEESGLDFSVDYPETWALDISPVSTSGFGAIYITNLQPGTEFHPSNDRRFLKFAIGVWQGGLAEFGTLEQYLSSPGRAVTAPLTLLSETDLVIGGVEAVQRNLSAPAVPDGYISIHFAHGSDLYTIEIYGDPEIHAPTIARVLESFRFVN